MIFYFAMDRQKQKSPRPVGFWGLRCKKSIDNVDSKDFTETRFLTAAKRFF
jgi:hypothetical protein